MYLKQKIIKLFLPILLTVSMGCYDPSTTTTETPSIPKDIKIKVKDYSFSYDTNQTAINGYFYIGLSELLDNNSTQLKRSVELINFMVDTLLLRDCVRTVGLASANHKIGSILIKKLIFE